MKNPNRLRAGLTALLVSLAASASQPSEEIPSPVYTLGWLTGCWYLKRENGYTEEHWIKPAGRSMLGLSRTVINHRMTEYEFMAIREVDGKLAFVANPSGQAEAVFPLKRLGEGEAVFENPAHDFPQRVSYRLTGSGAAAGLLGRIEGTLEGKERAVDFPYHRCT